MLSKTLVLKKTKLPAVQKPILIKEIKEAREILEQNTTIIRSTFKRKITAFIIVDGMQRIFPRLLLPCTISPEGFLEDAAILAFLDAACGLGVLHG